MLLEEDIKGQIPPRTDPAAADGGCSLGKALWRFPLGKRWPGPLWCLSFAWEGDIRDLRCRNNRRQQKKEGEETPQGCSPGTGARPGSGLPSPIQDDLRGGMSGSP